MPHYLQKKISIGVSSLDKLERSPAVGRLCGRLALAFLAASFVPDLILAMDLSRPYQLAQFSQDEYWFMKSILELQDYLLNGDWQAIRDFGSPFAYGFPFWLFAAAIAFPFYGHTMLITLFLRLVFMAMKYAAFFLIYRRIFALTQKPIVSLLSLVLLLGIPAFVFDGKIISPEYFIMLLAAAGWSALFVPRRRAQIGASFTFALATAIKINVMPLDLLFLPPLLVHPSKQRARLLKWWIAGAVPPLLLFLLPAQPFKEILAIGATHHVDYGLRYLSSWYGTNTLEFDDMLIGGWSVDFINWPLFLALFGFAVYRAVRPTADAPKVWMSSVMPMIAGTFFVSVLACFLTSLNSIMHPWFVFAPFLLLMGAGSLLIGAGRRGSVLMLVFLIVYVANFGERYVERWQYRIDKFDYIAATEPADAAVATWIATYCPKAREAVIDYNLIWPNTYDGYLQKMRTLIEVEDYRRLNGSAFGLLDNLDLLLLKTDRVKALLPPDNPSIKVPAGILGNFFPETAPYFVRQRDFPQLSVFAREGVCRKEAK